MYSIKPGRGPSAMGAIGSLMAIVFGVFWTMVVSSSGAPPLFIAGGVMFIVIGVIQLLFHLFNSTSKNRMSLLDVTTDDEEQDPVAHALGHSRVTASPKTGPVSKGGFCPYCGDAVASDYEFCPKCGKDI